MISSNTKVRVYKNLKTKTWSIKIKVDKKGWRKIASLDSCTIAHAKPIISRSGVERIRRRKEREVIAMIEGYFLSDNIDNINIPTKEVFYNPYKNYDFYYKDNTIFEGCKIAFFPGNCSHFKEGI